MYEGPGGVTFLEDRSFDLPRSSIVENVVYAALVDNVLRFASFDSIWTEVIDGVNC
jgi:hypothetical protein